MPAGRGTITDRKGVELAVSEEATTVFANPMLIKNPTDVAAELAPLLGRDQSELLPLLSDKDKGFVYLRRKLDPTLGDKIARLRIEGIDTVSEPNRTYPQGALAGQLLGSVGPGRQRPVRHRAAVRPGAARRGRPAQLVKDATGKVVSLADTKRQESGEDMRLTIDAALQERVEAVLGQVARDHRPKGATALVMDPRNGELLAMANYPRVNPNDLVASPKDGLQNRAVGSAFEPGSTFKAFTVAGALQDGKVTPETELEPAVADPGGRPDHRRGARPRRGDPDHLPDPGPVVQRGLGHDRPEARPQALRPLGAQVRLRQAHGRLACRARAAASCPRPRTTRARRWATCRSARAWP